MTAALKHPLLKAGGLLSPLIASLAQWHLVDDPELFGSVLTEALRETLREVDGLKHALWQVRRPRSFLEAGTFCFVAMSTACLLRHKLSSCPLHREFLGMMKVFFWLWRVFF